MDNKNEKVNKHCSLDTPRKVIIDINSSSVQNLKKSIATTTYQHQYSCKIFLKLLSKKDRKNKSVMDIKELQRGITITVLIP